MYPKSIPILMIPSIALKLQSGRLSFFSKKVIPVGIATNKIMANTKESIIVSVIITLLAFSPNLLFNQSSNLDGSVSSKKLAE